MKKTKNMKKNYSLLLLVFAISIVTSYAQSWTSLTSGTTQNLLGASFVNDNTGWVVGDVGTVLKTINGTTFTTQTSGTANTLYSAWFFNIDTGYVMGDGSTILKTTNGGTTYSSITPPVAINVRSIYFCNSSIGYIGGGNASSQGVILKTTDGGTTWTPLTIGTLSVIHGVYFTDVLTGYASDFDGSIIKTTDGGTTWTLQTSGTTVNLYGVYYTNSTTGYVVVENGTVLKTTNGGTTWTPQSDGDVADYFTSITFLDDNIGYIVGGNSGANTSTILKTLDAGVTWTVQATSSTRQYGSSFSTHNGYTCGLNGSILKITGLTLTGVNEYANNNNISIYPNPANNIVNINYQLPNNATEAIVNIFDQTGKLINSQMIYGNKGLTTLNVENLPNGLYLYSVNVNSTIIATQHIAISK